MIENISKNIQDAIKAFMLEANFVHREANELEKLYFSGGVSTDLGTLAGTDPASTASANTKDELVNGVTMIQEYRDFMENAAVTTSDYHSTLQNIINGDDPRVSTPAHTENFADRLLVVGTKMLEMLESADNINDEYFDTELSAAIGAISTTTVVFGADIAKQLYTDGINLVTQYRTLIRNGAPGTADRAATVAKWTQIS